MTNMACPDKEINFAYSCVASLKENLRKLKNQRKILEVMLVKQDLMKSEVSKLQNELDNLRLSADDTKIIQKYCSNKMYQEFYAVSIRHKQKLDFKKKLIQENHDLQLNIQRNTDIEQKIIIKNKKLEINRAKTLKFLKELQKQNKKEQVIYI